MYFAEQKLAGQSSYNVSLIMLPTATNMSGPSDLSAFFLSDKYPPFWTLQPTIATRKAQLTKWSSLILSYCRQNRIWRLTLVDALNTPLFHNAQLRKRLTLLEARDIVDWMAKEDGARRAEWIGRHDEKSSAWIYWRRPEEWADVLSAWVCNLIYFSCGRPSELES